MVRIITLKIKTDRLTQEYTASLQILIDGILVPESEIEDVKLPSFLELENNYKKWRYGIIGLNQRSHNNDDYDVHINTKIVTNRSTSTDAEACRQYAKLVEKKMQACLKTSVDSRWQEIRETLVRVLENSQDQVHVVIKSDSALWKFPWHCWDLIENNPNIGISFSLPSSKIGETSKKYYTREKVRILAVFGDDSDIDLEPDRQVFEKLNNEEAKIEFLDKRTADEFKKKVRQPDGWDILFFAGHGEIKDKTGRIYLNKNEYLEVYDFKNSLTEAIANGLQIAIFNSCEGVGLIEELAGLGLPIAIFMQEKIDDKVAQFFVKELLSEYVSGKTLYEAFNLARNRLEEKSQDVPGATLIPKLNQNTRILAPKWQDLHGGTNRLSSIASGDSSGYESAKIAVAPQLLRDKKIVVLKTILISLLVTTAVMGMRWFGFLQTSELQAFDRLMQQRPAENADPRILVVGADEADITQYGNPLPDKIIATTLDKLQPYHPLAIGLDIYRDITTPKEPQPQELIEHFKNNSKLISVCKYSHQQEQRVSPPPNSPPYAVSFVNLILDPPDDTVRIYPLIRSENPDAALDRCQTQVSLAFSLAYQYLHKKNIEYEVTDSDEVKWGKTTIKRLRSHSAAYQKIDDRGYQLLINYRASSRPDRTIARSLTIRDVLSDKFEPKWIEDKIILLSATAPSLKDWHMTPFDEKIPGVWIHAHAIVQLLSAVEDRSFQALIWWLPLWGDAVWVWIWSLIGSLCVLYWRFNRRLRSWHLILGFSVSIGILYSLCLFLFIEYSAWLPLIPAALALVATGATIILYFLSRTRNVNP